MFSHTQSQRKNSSAEQYLPVAWGEGEGRDSWFKKISFSTLKNK